VEELCRRWEVRATIVGRVRDPVPDPASGEPTGRLRVREGAEGPVLADVPAASLADDAPLYDRPMARPANLTEVLADDPADEPAGDAEAELMALLLDPRWIYQQYDHQLFLNTVVGPGGDAVLLRLAGPGLPPSRRGVAVSTDSNPRWCALDPRRGTAMVVAESVANVACVGATAVAVVNCINLGNPEHPEVMWQLSELVDGMADACRALGLPVIGGNVSLYNESAGSDIAPTPVIGVLGLVDHVASRPPGVGWEPGASLILVGPEPVEVRLGGSRWAVECRSRRGGVLPELDLAVHRRTTAFVAELVRASVAGGTGLLCGVHDVSAGGLAVALAEMAVRAGSGCRVRGVASNAALFGESPSRVLAATQHPEALAERARRAGVEVRLLGEVAGDRLVVEGLVDLSVGALSEAASGALGRPGALGG
jgi:phosphoribosylformylglycinamidine synthase